MKRGVRSHTAVFILILLGLATVAPLQASYAIAAGAAAAQTQSTSTPLTPDLESALNAAGPAGKVAVIVRLADQADLTSIQDADRALRLQRTIATLQEKAKATQSPVRSLLSARESEGRVSGVKSFWIFNGFSVTASPAVVRELAARPEVASVSLESVVKAPVLATTAGTNEANIDLVDAPALWNLGYVGQNVVVASLDTGVDATHPDLSAQWRGGSNSWFDPYGVHSSPFDGTGHGTAVMSIIVGGGAGGTNIGVAPGAKWISAKIFDDQGNATTTAIHQAFQWVLDPDGNPTTNDAPDVVNNSWAIQGCSLEFRPDVQALANAGIVPVFAAGNYGPSASTSVSPANYPEALAVGGIDNSSSIYYYSSRGPSACGETSAVYPEVVAPGVSVRGAARGGGYTYLSGTSLSSPHAAGVLALLLSANPNLTVSQQRQALVSTANDLGTVGPDNSFGYGSINALAAYQSILGSGQQTSLGVDSLITGKLTTKRRVTQFTQTSSFTAGDTVVIRAHVSDAAGAAVSGASVNISVKAPNGSVVANLSATSSYSGIAEAKYPTSRKSTRGGYTVVVNSASKSGYVYSVKVGSGAFTLN